MADVNFLPDPCSLPDAQKKRALNEKERLLYAPMAGVGGIVYDKDAVYIDFPASHVKQQVRVCLQHGAVFALLYKTLHNQIVSIVVHPATGGDASHH